MPDLNAIKEKLSGIQAGVAEKLNQIGPLKAWREKREASRPKDPDPLALTEIYKEGSTWTRLQVLAVYGFGLVALVSGGLVAKNMMGHLKSAKENEKLIKDVSDGLEKTQKRAIENADVVALGTFTANSYIGQNKEGTMSLDLWVRVNNPDAAALVNNKGTIFHDKTINALDELYQAKVSLLTPEGKDQARQRIRDALNSAMPEGQSVEEVFVQNFMVQ